MFFDGIQHVECIAKVFEAKYGLVYYIFGCFGAKNGLNMAFLVQNSEFWGDWGTCGVVFDVIWGVECSARLFEWKYGLVYYILAVSELKLAQNRPQNGSKRGQK